MEIVFLDAYTTAYNDISLDELNSLGNVQSYDYSTIEEGHSRGKNAVIIITNKYVVNEAALKAWPKCKYICVSATGFNNVAIEACQKYDIKVSNVRGYSTSSVVQHVFAGLLGVLNRTEMYNSAVDSGRWVQSRDFTFYDHSIEELEGKTIGVFGLGTIGAKVANIADSFGMNVLGVSKYPAQYKGPSKLVDADLLFSKSDIITLHAPLNASTRDLINQNTLSQMKPNAILVNTSRGPLINEADLAKHLKANPLFTAILDVLSNEPPLLDNPLLNIPNCKITPHQAWASINARTRLVKGIVHNIQAYQSGSPINLVTN